MLNIIICDDSQVDIAHLSECISIAEKELKSKFLVTCYNDADVFTKEVIKQHRKADLIFLDIFIKTKNGYDLAKELRRYDSMSKIVFFTSSPHYAVQSYSVGAFNYILKPAKQEAITSVLKDCLEDLKTRSAKHILVKQRNSVFPVMLSSILYAESKGRQIFLHTTSHGVIDFYQKLDELEKEIKEKNFLRCHQSFFVNMDYIHSVEDNCFKLIGGEEVIIRKVGMQEIKNKFFNYITTEI